MSRRVPAVLSALLFLSPLSQAQSLSGLRIMAPASPGGGWDGTSRAVQEVMQSQNIARPVQVFNVSGAGGTIGLAQLVNSKGEGKLMMMMGLTMVGAIQTNKSKVNLNNVVPIARLVGEYHVLVVPANSKYKTVADLVADWKKTPGLAIAGGSVGGTDHVLLGLLAEAAGVDPRKMNYVPFSGGGETLAAVLGSQVAGAIANYSEFESSIKSGKLRALGLSSKKRLAGVDVPTFIEQGLNVELANWRGIVAPPGISAQQRAELIAAADALHKSPAWKAVLKQRNWVDLYQSGSQFGVFLKLEDNRIKKVLSSIGLMP